MGVNAAEDIFKMEDRVIVSRVARTHSSILLQSSSTSSSSDKGIVLRAEWIFEPTIVARFKYLQVDLEL